MESPLKGLDASNAYVGLMTYWSAISQTKKAGIRAPIARLTISFELMQRYEGAIGLKMVVDDSSQKTVRVCYY
jgi:hypothetical protein